MKSLYKYPQDAYPYENIVEENRSRTLDLPEYELEDTGKHFCCCSKFLSHILIFLFKMLEVLKSFVVYCDESS